MPQVAGHGAGKGFLGGAKQTPYVGRLVVWRAQGNWSLQDILPVGRDMLRQRSPDMCRGAVSAACQHMGVRKATKARKSHPGGLELTS